MKLLNKFLIYPLMTVGIAGSVQAQYNNDVIYEGFVSNPSPVPHIEYRSTDFKSITSNHFIPTNPELIGIPPTSYTAGITIGPGGQYYDMMINAYDINGLPVFSSAYGTEGVENAALAIEIANDQRDLIVVGHKNVSTGPGTSEIDATVCRLDNDGTVNFYRSYGINGRKEVWNGLINAQGGYILIGELDDRILIAAKIDEAGNTIWMKEYTYFPEVGLELEGKDIIRNASGNYTIVGQAYEEYGERVNMFLMEINEAGDVASGPMVYNYGEIPGIPDFDNTRAQVVLLSDGNYAMSFETEKNIAGFDAETHICVAKIGADFYPMWASYYHQTGELYQSPINIAETGTDLLIFSQLHRKMGLLRLDALGNVVYMRRYNEDHPRIEVGYRMNELTDARYYFHGSTKDESGVPRIQRMMNLGSNGMDVNSCNVLVPVTRIVEPLDYKPYTARGLNYFHNNSQQHIKRTRVYVEIDNCLGVNILESGMIVYEDDSEEMRDSDVESFINNDILNVGFKSDVEGLAQITLYNTAGKVVSEEQVDLNIGYQQLSFSVAGLPYGLYLIKLSTSDQIVFTQKIVR